MQAGLRFHHVGIPTDTPHPGERYLAQYKVFISGYETSPYAIEWMRYEPGSPVPSGSSWPGNLASCRSRSLAISPSTVSVLTCRSSP